MISSKRLLVIASAVAGSGLLPTVNHAGSVKQNEPAIVPTAGEVRVERANQATPMLVAMPVGGMGLMARVG